MCNCNSDGFSVLCGGSDAGLLRVDIGQVRIRCLFTIDAQKGLISH